MKRLPYVEQRQLRSGATRYRAIVTLRGTRVVSPWVGSAEHAYELAVTMRRMPLGDGITLRGAVDQLLADVRAKRTEGSLRWYEGHLRAVTRLIPEETPLHRITPEQLEQFVRDRLQELARRPVLDAKGAVLEPGRRVKPATVNADLRALHRVFSVAIRRGQVTANPVRQLDRPRADAVAMDWFRADEMGELLARITDERAHDLVALLALTGIRRSEAARLEPGHVRVRARQLVVPGKTGTRVVPLSPDLDAPVARLMVRATDHLIDGVRELDRTLRQWSIRLAEPRLHAHALRHTFGTALVRQGERPDVVMRLMGHRSLQTTMRYWHEVGEDAVQAIGRLRILPRAPDRERAR